LSDPIPSPGEQTGYGTFPQMFSRSVAAYADEPALSHKVDGTFVSTTYRDLERRSAALALALVHVLDIQKGELIALISNNRPEWMLCSLAIHSVGAVDVPRASDTPSEILAAILSHAEPAVAILENQAQLEKVRGALPALCAAVLIDASADLPIAPDGPCSLYTLADLLAAGDELLREHPGEIGRRRAVVAPEDLATIIYTSGTSSAPKGVALTHANYMLNIEAIPKLLGIERERILSVLQPWHAYERQVQLLGLSVGSCLYYGGILTLRGDLKAVRPTVMATVPELWITLYKGVFQKIAAEKPAKRRLARWVVGRSLSYARGRRTLEGREPQARRQSAATGGASRLRAALLIGCNAPFHALADRLIYRELRASLGGCLRYPVVGGGPLPDTIDEFFDAAGLTLIEGYGMTETIVVMAIRDHRHRVLGTAGRFLDGMEHRIVDARGELCQVGDAGALQVRGPNVMLGYYKADAQTREVLAPDGWFATGDLARSHLDGSVRVLGRLDDTLVLTNGKNVNTVYLENELRASEWTERAVVVGAGRPYAAAFIVPSRKHLEALARTLAIPFGNCQELLEDPRIVEHYQRLATSITTDAQRFAPHERIQRVRLWLGEFRIGREISQTLKLRRQEFYRLYADEIEALYAD
jgi:long-chain acyl-CoA synthetase